MGRGLSGWLGPPPRDAQACLEGMARSIGGSPDRIELSPGALVARHSHRDGPLLLGWTGELDAPAFARRFREDRDSALLGAKDARALAVFDLEQKELVLAVDRFGIETLVFYRTPGGLAFATSAAALRAHPDVRCEVDPQSVYDYVYFHVVPSPRGIFRGFERLDPAECLVARRGELSRHRYFRPSYEPSPASEAELAEEYRETVRAAVGRCLARAEGKVGAFLSGGTDSSTVTGVVRELTGQPPHTYSIGFDVPGYDESTYAQIAVRHFGASHHEHVVTPADLERAIPRLAETYDEPFGNASAIASYYCALLARGDGVSTLLAGDGGDEIFAGNERYAKQKVFERYFLLPAPLRAHVIEPALARIPESVDGLLGKAQSYVRQASTPLPDRLQSYNLLTRLSPQHVFASDFLASVSPEEPLELLRASYREAPTSSMLNRLLYLDIKFTLADNDLRKVVRTCAMVGVAVDFPFLDAALVDFANRVPPELKLKGQHLRYFFKQASRGFLPEEILTKKKHGFGVPCGRWMRDEKPLRALAYDSLASLQKRGYLKDGFADELIALHGENPDYYGVLVWVLTMLEQWHQKHAP